MRTKPYAQCCHGYEAFMHSVAMSTKPCVHMHTDGVPALPTQGRKRETPKTKKKKRSGQKRSGQKRKSKDKGAKEPSAKKQKLADGKGKAKDDEAESEAEEAQVDEGRGWAGGWDSI